MAILQRAAPRPVYIPGGWDPRYHEHDNYAQTGGNDRGCTQRQSSDPGLEYEQIQIQHMTQAYAARLAQRTRSRAAKELIQMNARFEREWKETAARIERKYAPQVAQRKLDELYKKNNREQEKEERDFERRLRKLHEKYDSGALQRKIAKLDAAVEEATRKIQKELQAKLTKVQNKHANDDYAAEEELYSWRCKYATKEQQIARKHECDCAELKQKYSTEVFEREVADLEAERNARAGKREEKFRRDVARWTQTLMEAPNVLEQKLYDAHAKMTAKTHKEGAELEYMNKSRQQKDEEKTQRFAWIQSQDFINRQVPMSYARQEMGSRSYGHRNMTHGHQNMPDGQQNMSTQSGGIGIPPFAIQGPGGLQVHVDPAEVFNNVGGLINSFMSQGQGNVSQRMLKGALRGMLNR